MIDISQIPLFALADRRLGWVAQRQTLLAQNVANADTPGWQPRDVAPFAAFLAAPHVTLARTDGAHLGGTLPDAAGTAPAKPAERAPDGNGVALDKELMKVADTTATQELVTGLTQAYLGMFRTATGH